MGTDGSKKEEQASLEADFLATLCGENGAIIPRGYTKIMRDSKGVSSPFEAGTGDGLPRRLLVLAPFLGTAGPADGLPCPQPYRRIDDLFEALGPSLDLGGGPAQRTPLRSLDCFSQEWLGQHLALGEGEDREQRAAELLASPEVQRMEAAWRGLSDLGQLVGSPIWAK